MMKMNQKKKRFLSVLCTILALAGLTRVTYAWFSIGDSIGSVKLSVVKINSSVSLYRANDVNQNGVPDRRVSPDTETWYYTEPYDFTLVGSESALSVESSSSIVLDMQTDEMSPSKVYTYKFTLENKSEAVNVVSFRLGALSETAALNMDLLSTLSLRVTPIEPTLTDGVYSYTMAGFGEKVLLGDYISGGAWSSTVEGAITGSGELNIFALLFPELVNVKSEDLLDLNNIQNYYDFWLQIEMEPYMNLPASVRDNLTQEEYNALAGQSLATTTLDNGNHVNEDGCLLFRIYFEVMAELVSSGS